MLSRANEEARRNDARHAAVNNVGNILSWWAFALGWRRETRRGLSRVGGVYSDVKRRHFVEALLRHAQLNRLRCNNGALLKSALQCGGG